MNVYTCEECGSTKVEICMPAWFNPNKSFKFVEMDSEAKELTIFCNDCEDTTGVISPNGRVIRGIW